MGEVPMYAIKATCRVAKFKRAVEVLELRIPEVCTWMWSEDGGVGLRFEDFAPSISASGCGRVVGVQG